MSEKFRQDGKAADDNSCCDLGQSPEPHHDDVIADVRLFHNFPGVVCPYDGRHTSTVRNHMSAIGPLTGQKIVAYQNYPDDGTILGLEASK